jgi:hypothetical protein
VAEHPELPYFVWEHLVVKQGLLVIIKILTGIMKAKNVIENAPEKFKNRPNLGIMMEKTPVKKTMQHLNTMLFNLGYLKLLGSFSKQPVFSEISKAGIT